MPSLTHTKRRLQGVEYVGEKFEHQDLRSMSAPNSVWEDCEFVGVKLTLADFSGSRFSGCVFRDCTPIVACFARCRMDGVRFVDCDMEQAIFTRSVLNDVGFTGCRLALANFYEATIRKAQFSLTNLADADLRFIECNDASYNDVVLWNAQISLGCQFFRGKFDERSVNMFVAMASRIHPDPIRAAELAAIAGNEMRLVDRMMRVREA